MPPPGGGGGLQEGGAAEGGWGGVEGGGEDAEVHHVPAEADEEPHTHRPVSQVAIHVYYLGRMATNILRVLDVLQTHLFIVSFIV